MFAKSVYFALFGFVFLAFFGLIIFNINFYYKKTTADSVCIISSAQDLIDFATYVNGDNVTSANPNLSAKLTADIDLTTEIFQGEFLGIGTDGYSGTFDGNGHVISLDLSIFTSAKKGLFVETDGAVIKNLVVKSSLDTSKITKTSRIGGLISDMSGTTVENCAVYLDIKGTSTKNITIGGICGSNTVQGANVSRISNSIVYLKNASNCSEIDVISCVRNNEAITLLENSMFYCDGISKYVEFSTNCCFHSSEGACSEGSCPFNAPENMSVCGDCGLYYLNFDKTHNTTITTPQQEITPTLLKTEYVYSPDGVTLQFDNIIKVYEADDVEFSYTVSGDTVGNQTAKVSLNGADADKYVLTADTVEFVITPKPITVEIQSVESVYGAEMKEVDYSISCADDVSIEFDFLLNNESAELSKVGEYVIVPKTSNLNYEILDYNLATYTIMPAPITLEQTGFSKVFDNEQFVPELSLKGICDFDKSAVSYKFLDTLPSNFGTYSIKIAIDGDASSNYKLVDDVITLSIEKKTVSVTWSDTEFYFDNSAHVPTPSVNSGIQNYSIDINVSHGEINAGEYSATVITKDENFLLNNSTCNYKILPYNLTLDYGKNTFVFNAEIQEPSVDFTVPFNYDYDLEIIGGAADVGNYTLTVSSGDKNIYILNPNFNFSITPLTVEVIFENSSSIFNGKKQFPKYSINCGIDYDFQVLESVYAENVGEYNVTVTTNDKNINLVGNSVEFEILPYNVELIWTGTEHIFDNQSYLPQVTYDLPFEYGFVISLSGAQTNVGDYLATAYTNDRNINLLNVSCDFSILPHVVTLKWGSTAFIYSGYPQVPEYSYDDFGYSFEIDLSASGVDAGGYLAKAICNNVNITLENAEIYYDILPLEVSVQWGDTEFSYDGTYHVPNAVIDIENIEINPNCVPILNVVGGASEIGEYTASATTNGNFILLNNSCNFSIVPNTITLSDTPDDISITITGEINTGQIESKKIDAESLKSSLPAGYEIYFAISLSDYSVSSSESEKYGISINLPVFATQNFEIFIINDKVNVVNYENLGTTFNFETNELGVICIAFYNDAAVTLQNLITYGLISLGVIVILAIIVCPMIYRRHHRVIIRRTDIEK